MADFADAIKSAFYSAEDADNGMGVRPVIFDVISPDGETSLLPDDLKMVLHVNPSSLQVTYEKLIERIQTLGGWVEQHWGDGAVNLTLEMATGGFMRLGSGLSNVTGPNQSNAVIAPVSEQAMDLGGTRRETIAYDKYLDMLALFHHNGSIYDSRGAIAMQGMIKITFDGMSWFGWFNSFSVQEEADKPYQFSLSAAFTVQREVFELRTFPALGDNWADGFKPSGGV
jgi:hypothetical protein